MKFKARIFSTQEPASDSSRISARVAQEFFASEGFKQALKDRKLFGTLSHLARNLQASKMYTPALAKTIGKNDQLLLDQPMTHILTNAWLEDDGWAYGEFEVLDKSLADDVAVQRIKRLEFLLSNHCKIGISCVIIGYWNDQNGFSDLVRFVALSGADLTCNPSWKNAGITDIDLENGENPDEQKTFSELDANFSYDPKDYEDSSIKVKMFSTEGIDAPKSSKIGGKFCSLKAKCFSFNGEVIELEPSEFGITEEAQKEFTEEPKVEEETQKEFTQAQVRERLRESKMGVRMELRRTILSYRQVVKQMGGNEKIDPEDLKTLKSLLSSDLLRILNRVTPEILEGKQINTLLGLSSLGKSYREYGQKLNIILRLSLQELKRNKFVNKTRYVKLQEAYTAFINAILDDVFGPNPSPIVNEDENLEENGGQE